ncbi:MAG: hypothetical protein ABSF46_16805, partial [Terriglobia bacterium]
APSGAVNINATFRPTAHAVGYFLAPLRGFRSPGALSKRLCGPPSPQGRGLFNRFECSPDLPITGSPDS